MLTKSPPPNLSVRNRMFLDLPRWRSADARPVQLSINDLLIAIALSF